MKTIENLLHQITDTKSIMQDLKEILRKIDPEFCQKEAKFLCACNVLERELGDSITPSVGDYLAAKEEAFSMEIIYIAWQGFQLNRDIFENPVNALMLKGDYEELHRERRLQMLPTARNARRVQGAFVDALKQLGEDKWVYEEAVDSFYTYLETTGYKVAHYFGFRLADLFLPYVIPGYTNDEVNTLFYSGALKRCLSIDIHGLE